MKIDLTDDEREVCADRVFWLWKYAEIDAMAIKGFDNVEDEAKQYVDDTERFYRELYNKLKGDDGQERLQD